MDVHWSAVEIAEVPTDVMTTTSTFPIRPLGALVTIVVGDWTEYIIAQVPPNVTPVTLTKLVPVIVMDMSEPVTLVTVGGAGGAVYVNWSIPDVADVPLAETTVTSTVPAAEAGGAVAVIEPLLFTI